MQIVAVALLTPGQARPTSDRAAVLVQGPSADAAPGTLARPPGQQE